MDSPASAKPSPLLYAAAGVAGATFLYLLFTLLTYGKLGGYLDHIEANIAIAAWSLLEGHNLYQKSDEWPIFANYYGPLVYLAQSLSFAIAGASVPVSKLAGALAVTGASLLFFFHAKRCHGLLTALFGAIIFNAFLLLFAPYSIWNRPDPFIILLVTTAVWANGIFPRRDGGLGGPAAVGACIGLAVNMKVHAFLYFLPLILDSCGGKGVRRMTVVAVVSLIVFLLPFALPQVSLTTYAISLMRQASEKSIDSTILLSSLRYATLFLVPAFLLIGAVMRKSGHIVAGDAPYALMLAASVGIMLYPASVPGQGYYHLLPLFPIAVDATLRLARGFDGMGRTRIIILSLLAVVLLTISAPVQRRLKRNLDRLAGETAAEEIRSIAARYGDGSLQMGYGESFENYRYTFYKPALVFAGNPYNIDSQAIMEFQLVGIDVVARLSGDFSACRTRHWLIPKDEPPFRMKSHYGNRPLFGESADVFLSTHEKTAAFTYFDLWSCKDKGHPQ